MSLSDQATRENDCKGLDAQHAYPEKSPKGNVGPKTPYYDSFYVTSKFPPYTAESLYGSSELTAPEGWEFTGEFRPGLAGETILLPMHRTPYTLKNDGADTPRLILRKKVNLLEEKNALYNKFRVIPTGYKEIDYRQPREGEIIFGLDGIVHRYNESFKNTKRIILEKLPLRKRYIFEETGEEIRSLQSHEYGRHTTTNQIYQQPETVGYTSAYRYKPLTLKIEEF